MDGDQHGALRAAVAILIAGFVCVLALLPAAIAHGFAPPPEQAAAGAAALVGPFVASKSAAVAQGDAIRAWRARKGSVAVAYVD